MVFLLWLFVQATSAHNAESISFDRLTTENVIRAPGLSQNSIYTILQDSDGYMWFGTWDGLNRYDGYTFAVFKSEAGLSHNSVRCLLEDSEGYLWIGTDNGLNRLNRSTAEIAVFLHDPGDPGSPCGNYVNSLFQDDEGNIWIGTSTGLCLYSRASRSFITLPIQAPGRESSRSVWVTRIAGGRDGKIWLGSYEGLYVFDPVTNAFRHLLIATGGPGSSYGPEANVIQALEPSFNEMMWIGTDAGIFRISTRTYAIEPFTTDGPAFGLGDQHVTAILQDETGLAWIGTMNGLHLFDPARKVMETFKNSAISTSISNNDIRCIYEDPHGRIWIGTYSGLNKVDKNPSRFVHYRHDPEQPAGLSNSIIYSILEDEGGKIWLATFDGVNILDRQSGQVRLLRHDPKDMNSLSGNKVRCIIRDSKGYFWIGTEMKGLNRYDPRTGRFNRFTYDPENPSGLPDDNIYLLAEDSKGRIWAGTPGGARIIRTEPFDIQPISDSKGKEVILSGQLIWSFLEDSKGNFWIGTTSGLNRINGDFDSIAVFRHIPGDPTSLANNGVLYLTEDRQGYIWIGTMGGGLCRYDPATKKFTTFGEEEGLPNSVIYAAIEDEEGNLWLSSNGGIIKFIRDNGIFISYDAIDGVQGSEFNMGAYFRNEKGEIFFGGMNGLNIFHPGNIRKNLDPPKVVFTGVRVFNEKLNRTLNDGDTLILGPSDNFFTIEFSALDYTNPAKNWYRYRLEGYDGEWVIRDARNRIAEYKKVPHGHYTFRASGSNNDGIWNEEGIQLYIVLRASWYETLAFRVSIVVFLILLIWGFIYYRFLTIRRKHDMERKMLLVEKQVIELEQKALRLQMNPHFIFNSLNAIQNFVISNETEKAVNYLAKFSHLMRMILANSMASAVSLKDELKGLFYYMDLERLRFDNRFDYRLDIDPSIEQDFIEIPPMLLQPYVENAILHGFMASDRPGLLLISLRINRDLLLCTIEDNGIGRAAAAKLLEQSGINRQSRGMMITRERLEVLNRQRKSNFSVKVTDLKDADGKATGTRVEINIQFKRT
jgi:ligand-binding sensor domain-containing protein